MPIPICNPKWMHISPGQSGSAAELRGTLEELKQKYSRIETATSNGFETTVSNLERLFRLRRKKGRCPGKENVLRRTGIHSENETIRILCESTGTPGS